MFKEDANKMWNIRKNGVRYSLKPDLQELSNPLLRLALSKKNVNYSIIEEGDIVKIFIEESNGLYDWKQNFMAYSIKTNIDGNNLKVHAGFFITAKTVFNHLNMNKKLEGKKVESYGYSHGAGALPIFGLLVRGLTPSTLLDDRVIGFESPRTIIKPSKEIKELCKNDIWHKQGEDVVTSVPWWMKHLGTEVKQPSRKQTGVKRLLRYIYDHDIYWTDESDARGGK